MLGMWLCGRDNGDEGSIVSLCSYLLMGWMFGAVDGGSPFGRYGVTRMVCCRISGDTFAGMLFLSPQRAAEFFNSHPMLVRVV